ncbi:MAG: alpha/beta fold hydrolase [Acidobacteria bacterium]|nr:alpha/beta fold hydrolase [Acidobacteriota bacterium]
MTRLPSVLLTAFFLLSTFLLVTRTASAQSVTISVSSKAAWTDSGLVVQAGDLITISGSGSIQYDSAGSTVGPDGFDTTSSACNYLITASPVRTHSLVGNIANASSLDGKGFFVGSNFQGTVPIANTTSPTGKLFLGFNDGFVRCDRSGLDSGGVADNSGSFTATITVVPGGGAAQPVPVILVHGWCGSSASFGSLKQLLIEDSPRAIVAEFDYAGNASGIPLFERQDLTRLADRLAQFIQGLTISLGVSQVDVVAHSMGGLLVRAWMAGLTDQPYSGQIRRLVLAGTPHFGVEDDFVKAGLYLLRQLGRVCTEDDSRARDSQAGQMIYGSQFIKTLHEQWTAQLTMQTVVPKDILTIVGCSSANLPGGACVGDAIVVAASATLPVTAPLDYRVRWLNRTHFNSLVNVTSRTHETYILIKEFFDHGTATAPVPGGIAGNGIFVVPLVKDTITQEPFIEVHGVNFDRNAMLPPTCAIADRAPTTPRFFRPGGATGWWTFLNASEDCWLVHLRGKYSSPTSTLFVTAGRPSVAAPLVVGR